jgi:hypothetical protein
MATYEIIIKGDGTAEGGDTKKRSVSPNAKSPSVEKKAANGRQIITGVAAYTFAKNLTSGIISHEIRMVGLRTGQVERQQMRQFNYQVGQQVFSFGESIAMGAIMGSAGGPGGALAGAAIAATMSAVNYAVGIGQRHDEINTNRAIESLSIGMANIRAGALGSRGGSYHL